MIEIVERGRYSGRNGEISYREVLRNGEVVAAIWRTPERGYRRWSVVVPDESERQRRFKELAAAIRWADRNLSRRA